MATWRDPTNTAAQPSYAGWNMEAAGAIAGTCAGNRTIPGQVTKGFWDLDDANNEGAVFPSGDDDSVNFTTLEVLNFWDNFPSGTANRQDEEPSPDGVNVWDYTFNAWPTLPYANYATLIYHNCTNDQIQ